MEFLTLLDMNVIIAGILMALSMLLIYPALRTRRKINKGVVETLKLQEKTCQQLNLIIGELKRSNRFLAELTGLEVSEMPEEESTIQSKLYVGNIDYAATEAELSEHFARYGKVEFVNIPVNRYNGRTRGFGFVTFSSKEEASDAMALNGSEFRGRPIQVNFAKERDQ